MFNFAAKALSGIVSAAMMLFSSYEGNHVAFSEVLVGHDTNLIRIRTELVSAFENDFEQIFRSGSPITITYTLTVERDGNLIDEIEYQNTIIFDPMNRYFQINAEAANYYTYTESCEELRVIISQVDIFYDYLGIEGTYSFYLKAYMDSVNLESLEREFDPMLLWYNRVPKVSFDYKVLSYES
jgi:hypothetical protein